MAGSRDVKSPSTPSPFLLDARALWAVLGAIQEFDQEIDGEGADDRGRGQVHQADHDGPGVPPQEKHQEAQDSEDEHSDRHHYPSPAPDVLSRYFPRFA